MIVCYNTFPLVLYIVPQRKVTTSLVKHPFFCYNRATKEENVAPEISPGIFYLFANLFSFAVSIWVKAFSEVQTSEASGRRENHN